MNIKEYLTIARNHKSFPFFMYKFFPIVMKWEGSEKLHKVKHDRGGWTKWGIAWNFWHKIFDNFEDFKNTTKEEACAFAFVRFYLAIKADLVPLHARLYYFDMSYNMGTSRAIKIMQQSIGVKADGIIGPITKSKMDQVTEKELKTRRDKFYYRLVERNYKLKKFLRGWLNRSNAIFKHKY